MKKYFSTLLLAAISHISPAQTNNILVRHDTTKLKDGECEWIVKSLQKNDPTLTTKIGMSVPEIILRAVEKGRLKAVDPETGKPIPAKEIFTWKSATDSVPEYNSEGNISRILAIKRVLNASSITQINIYHDWYFDISTDKLHSELKWLDLVTPVSSPMGDLIGYRPYCRIYY